MAKTHDKKNEEKHQAHDDSMDKDGETKKRDSKSEMESGEEKDVPADDELEQLASELLKSVGAENADVARDNIDGRDAQDDELVTGDGQQQQLHRIECASERTLPAASKQMHWSHDVPKKTVMCAQPYVTMNCGAPMFARVFTLLGGGDVQSRNSIFDFSDGRMFQQDVMCRTVMQVATEASRAERFFLSRYGLDFTRVAWKDGFKKIDGAQMMLFQTNTSLKLRVYTISSINDRSGGGQPLGSIKVWQGGWMVRITKNNVRLGGEFGARDGALRAYDEGTMLFYGDYKWQGFEERQTQRRVRDLRHPDGPPRIQIINEIIPQGKPVFVKYASHSPMVVNENGQFVIDNMLMGDKRGRSRGMIATYDEVHSSSGVCSRTPVNVAINEVWTYDLADEDLRIAQDDCSDGDYATVTRHSNC